MKSNKIKGYSIIIGLIIFVAQHGMYLLGHNISLLVGIAPFLPKINAIDNAFPIISIFIIPYVWAYAYWAMGPVAVSKCDRQHFLDFIAAYIFALVLGMLILAFAPTYMDRTAEGLYENTGSIFDGLRHFWYSLDGDNIAYNLFPSFHCLNSTICYLGVRKRSEISKWFRIYSLVITVLIYLSTLFVKQHYFLDVISGIVVAIISYIISKKFHLGKIFNFIGARKEHE